MLDVVQKFLSFSDVIVRERLSVAHRSAFYDVVCVFDLLSCNESFTLSDDLMCVFQDFFETFESVFFPLLVKKEPYLSILSFRESMEFLKELEFTMATRIVACEYPIRFKGFSNFHG